ncbi:hypothetical protein ACTXP6_13765, partial [Klebsiella pneumoniae]
MKHIYVASHGHFARGLVNSLSLLIGDEHGVIPVCAYDEDIGREPARATSSLRHRATA